MADVLLDFEDLSAGDFVNNQYAADGVTISSTSWHAPMIFDTANPTGGDGDLATGNLGNVLILSEDNDSSDPDDNAGGGTFVFTFDEPSTVNSITILDIEENGYVKLYDENDNYLGKVYLPDTGNNGQAEVTIDYDNVARMEITICGSGAIDNISFTTPEPELDGVVDGTAGDDLIDVAYTGDPEGDMIDNGDAILPGEVGDDDIVDALGGDDTIIAGEGNDEVYAGSGADTIEGNDGDDIIYGDSNYGGAGAGSATREVLEWDKAPNFGDNNDASGFTQNTGSVDVTFSIITETGSAVSQFETDAQNVSGIDADGNPVNDNSSFYSETKGDGNDGDYALDFSDPVENVSFRVNDIDGDGVVTIKAYDENNNPIEVTLTGGSRLTMSDTDGVAGDDTATSQGGYESDTSAKYSMLVEIAGPVARIEILHEQDGHDNSGINVTDVYFDVPVVDDGADGNDLIYGGAGNDIIFGEGGDDEIYGGEGNDTIDGGSGNDYIQGNKEADIIHGGDDDDTIYGQGGDDELYGDDGNDTIIGGIDNDYIEGGDGNDTIDGFSGDDEIYGGEGDDNIIGGGGDDSLFGEGGDDTIAGGNNVDYIDGGDGDDYITAGSRDDTVLGGDGNDEVYGEQGNDYIDTSAPLSSNPLPDLGYPGLFPADADPDNDKDFVDGGDGSDTIITGDDDDIIIGGKGDDIIDGGFDQDDIDGGEGDDYIVGGEGSDTIDGGAGNDTIYGGLDPIFPDSLNIPDDVDLVPNNGKDVINGGEGNDTIFGQDDDDIIYGDEGNDTIDGGIDDDTIFGGTGKDTIIGGEGEDTLSGGDDQDTFLGGNGGDYVDGGSGGVDYDTLDLTGSDVDFITYTSADKEDGIVTFNDGTTMEFEEIENVIPCFTPGARIATPKGERLVEELREGDKIITRDNGIQEIRWLGAKRMDSTDLAVAQHLKPVLIRAGALGQGLPLHDMIVSPNHRVLVANETTSLYFEEHEVLVAAKHLVGKPGIERLDVAGLTYIHFMFDQHQVVLSDGAWTESFQPGDYTLKGMGNAQRSEIFELFPELTTTEGLQDYHAARKTLKKHEASLLNL
ncbi:hemolysin-type calcium-binding repeat family protein [Actibacterium atlanticum]|uniref:Hemolysin-type calcium-binding repeat family protein n=1 Tax=Actibacterium atlanticum TaxID=1461693 RepID=A0A058ZR51_9RHOB|nr:Hint domain-containing protein [Actibacterium atlanticum]KCV83642.1 hemolysin-type calcium-binding repeat family protein [Actibacterium atlanticum]